MPRAPYRVLRALASVNVFAEDEEGRFRLTPLAEPLRTDVPGALRAFAIMLGTPESIRRQESPRHQVADKRTVQCLEALYAFSEQG
jgi:hypothetical protein